MKKYFLKLLFKIFSHLADKTNGAKVFVKPKLWLGTLILGIGVTACTNATKSLTQQSTCYEPAIAPDTVEAITKCYKMAIDTMPVEKQNQIIQTKSITACYDINIEPKPEIPVLCYITIEIPADTVYDENKIYDVVDEMPQFIGGEAKMMEFLSTNIHYPDSAKQNGFQDRVICQFVVEKDGSISDIRSIRSSEYSILDKEAIRIISSMPKWKNGMLQEKPVRVRYTLPVRFKLQ